MGRNGVLSRLATVCLMAINSVVVQPAQASAVRFYCGVSSGVPSTMAQTGSGRAVSVIRWTSATFNEAGWSPQRRCQEVSQRFEEFRQQGRLAYLTTGRMNQQPVICTAREHGGACDGLLYTLKPGQDPTSTLRNLLQVRVKARGPLNETSSRVYVSIDELVGNSTELIPGSPEPASASGKTIRESIW